MDECEGGEGRRGQGGGGRRKKKHPAPPPQPSTMKAFRESGQLVGPAAGGRTYGRETASLARTSTDLS